MTRFLTYWVDDVLKMRFAKVENFEKCSTSCGGDSLFADSTGCPNEWQGSFYTSDFQLNLEEVQSNVAMQFVRCRVSVVQTILTFTTRNIRTQFVRLFCSYNQHS